MALFRSGPATRDLRGFLKLLEQKGQLRRITAPVDPDLELAAIADRVLAMGGPAPVSYTHLTLPTTPYV